MKSLFTGFLLLTLATLPGCTQGTPGGPGTTEAGGKKPAFGQADDTFNLSVPVLSLSIQQGVRSETAIGIKRAKNFDEDVALTFTELPAGVTVEPMGPILKHGDLESKITFQATEDAPLGDFRIKVIGHPSKGSDAHVEFKLTVAAKDSFKLTMPLLTTSLKQGEAKTVTIGIKRDKTFDQDVAVTFADLPTGVTAEPATSVVKHGDADAQVTLSAAADAALGNFTVKFTGHPAKGADASNELKLTIVKE
jgi:hypothetical protein